MCAVQSLLFNEMARATMKRIADQGEKWAPGDLVIRDKTEVSMSDDVQKKSGESAAGSKRRKVAPGVQILGAEPSFGVTLHGLVLPLPGTSTIYPDNEARIVYLNSVAFTNLFLIQIGILGKRIEVAFGINFGEFEEYTLQGSYRSIFVRPQSVKVDVVSSTKAALDLPHVDGSYVGMPTESNVRWQERCLAKDQETISQQEESVRKEEKHGIAIRLQFQLPTSSYASVCLSHILGKEPREPESKDSS